MLTIVGIDPGKTGAICVYTDVSICFYKNTQLKDLLWDLQHHLEVVDYQFFIEVIHASAVMSQPAAFNYGMGYGRMLGAIEMVDMFPTLVRPKVWQAHFKIKAKDYDTRKDVLWEKAQQLYGGSIYKYQADAYLIARYGYDTILKQQKDGVK